MTRAVTARLASRYSSLSGFLVVDQPRDPEAINNLAEPQSPEGLGNRYLYGAVFREGAEDALRLIGIPGPEHHTETLRFLVIPRHGVTGLQQAVPEGEPGVQDLLGPTRRRLAGHRSTFPRHHKGDLASQAFLIKLKGLLALAVKVKVGIQRHWVRTSV